VENCEFVGVFRRFANVRVSGSVAVLGLGNAAEIFRIFSGKMLAYPPQHLYTARVVSRNVTYLWEANEF